MKKRIIVLFMFVGALVSAQQEVKVDFADAIVMKTLEISYEYYLGDQSSIGLSALFNLEKQSANFRYNENQMFTPFFRHYLTSNRNWNHFGEVFLGINSGNKKLENGGSKQYTDGALGVSFGSKYVSNGGLLLGGYVGIGRNLFTSDSYAAVPRVGFNIGYRFN